jgi:selenocysteine lyase/cysteine desulfurase
MQGISGNPYEVAAYDRDMDFFGVDVHGISGQCRNNLAETGNGLQHVIQLYEKQLCKSRRSAHKMARISSSLVLKTREALSELFYIQNPLDIAFTANATQALNLAIQGCYGRVTMLLPQPWSIIRC